jgi:hypothetical protein
MGQLNDVRHLPQFTSGNDVSFYSDPKYSFELNGAGTKIRTRDLLITNQLLYQLSYTGTGYV